MGANAQTSVPAFTAGQVLTAQQQTEINTGIPVFATTTTRDAAFGGTGEKVLAEGQMAYIENIAGSSAVQYYDGAAWATLVTGGLTLITAQTIGSAVSSVTVSDVFSSTYDNYRIIINGSTASTSLNLLMQLGSTTTAYYRASIGFTYGGATNSGALSNTSAFNLVSADANGFSASADVIQPFLAARTTLVTLNPTIDTAGTLYMHGGYQNSATSFTGFTLTTSTGTVTGGTIRVYGYQNS